MRIVWFAVAKYLKIDETKESVHNLRDRFAELQSRITFYIDLIRPWKDESHYTKHSNEKCKNKGTQWITFIEDLESPPVPHKSIISRS